MPIKTIYLRVFLSSDIAFLSALSLYVLPYGIESRLLPVEGNTYERGEIYILFWFLSGWSRTEIVNSSDSRIHS